MSEEAKVVEPKAAEPADTPIPEEKPGAALLKLLRREPVPAVKPLSPLAAACLEVLQKRRTLQISDVLGTGAP